MSDLPKYLKGKELPCTTCGQNLHLPERTTEALAIAWEALSKNVEYNHRDAEGPELRAQNEGNYRRSKDAMRRIEELGK